MLSRILDIKYGDNSENNQRNKTPKSTGARQIIEVSKEVNRNCSGLEGMTYIAEFLPLVAKSEF